MAIPYIREDWEDDVTEITAARMDNIEETLDALASSTPSAGDIPMWDAGAGKFVFSPGRGEPNGVAALDETGRVPAAQLPTASGGAVPAGFGGVWYSNVAPSGWAICDGSTLVGAQTTYPELWANVDPAWKSGANIVLPNLKGRIPVGRDATQTEFDVLGEAMGAKTVALSVTEMPAHVHGVTDPGHVHTVPARTGAGAADIKIDGNDVQSNKPTNSAVTGISIQSTGGGAAHSNLQPGIVVNWIIKL